MRVEELPPQPRGSHALQLQLYVLLMEKNLDSIAQAINQRISATDHADPIPPDAPIIGAELVYLDMSGQKRIPVELLPRPERLELLKQRLALHIQAELPGVLTTPSELWQCDYCPVRKVCSGLYGAPVGKEMPTTPSPAVQAETASE